MLVKLNDRWSEWTYFAMVRIRECVNAENLTENISDNLDGGIDSSLCEGDGVSRNLDEQIKVDSG